MFGFWKVVSVSRLGIALFSTYVVQDTMMALVARVRIFIQKVDHHNTAESGETFRRHN